MSHPEADEVAALSGCVAGAAHIEDIRRMLDEAGFTSVRIQISPRSAEIVGSWMAGAERFVASATIEARRGGEAGCCGPRSRA